MLIGYSRPSALSIGFAATQAGGGFLADSSMALVDGMPARVARLQWMSPAGGLADHMRIPVYLSSASSIRVVGVLGLTLPPGVRLQVDLVDGHVGLDVVYQIATRSVTFADGSVGAWFVFPAGLAAVDRFDLLIFNDVDGAASIAADTVFDCGEMVGMPALEVKIDAGMKIRRVDPSQRTRTRGSQLAIVPRPSYRQFSATASFAKEEFVRYGGSGGMDWERLIAALDAGGESIAIPRWKTGGAVDLDKVNAFAMYGVSEFSDLSHIRGPFWNFDISFEEIPTIG